MRTTTGKLSADPFVEISSIREKPAAVEAEKEPEPEPVVDEVPVVEQAPQPSPAPAVAVPQRPAQCPWPDKRTGNSQSMHRILEYP